MSDFEKLDARSPPAYTPEDPSHLSLDVNHLPDPGSTFDTFSATGGHEIEVHKAHDSGRHVRVRGNTTGYYLRHYQADLSTTNVILYNGDDASGLQLAEARFSKSHKDFEIQVHSPYDRAADVHRHGGGVFPSFEFDCPMETKSNNPLMMSLSWTKTHDARLGASPLSSRDYKLVDKATRQVMAVYLEKQLSRGPVQGVLTFQHKVDQQLEMASLIVLLALLEK